MDKALQLIGIARCDGQSIEVRVHPMLIEKTHPMASVSGSFNAVFLHGDAVDDVMFYGRGAGDLPTGSAVMGDVFEIASGIVNGSTGKTRDLCYKNLPIKKIEDTVSRYYIRMKVEDKPGVLGTITSVFGKNGVSIEQIVQKAKKEDNAEIVIITSAIRECHIHDAFSIFEDLSVIKSKPALIRVY